MSYQKIFDENIKSDLLINTNLLTKVSISSFYCCEKESYHMNIWIIWEEFNDTIT